MWNFIKNLLGFQKVEEPADVPYKVELEPITMVPAPVVAPAETKVVVAAMKAPKPKAAKPKAPAAPKAKKPRAPKK
jgi:hypothetical protein